MSGLFLAVSSVAYSKHPAAFTKKSSDRIQDGRGEMGSHSRAQSEAARWSTDWRSPWKTVSWKITGHVVTTSAEVAVSFLGC